MPGIRRTHGPVPLSDLFSEAFQYIDKAPSLSRLPEPKTTLTDGLIFSGNLHDNIPRALLLDKRLTPLERNAWQALRLLDAGGITAFPTYDQLAPWLASMPCTDKASHETVARALTVLRLTRWISLVCHRRDPKTGRIQGNLYVLHDEPLTLFEAIQLDRDYLGLVSNAMAHASKSVQRVGVYTLKELSEDPQLIGKTLPNNILTLSQHLSAQGWILQKSYTQDMHMHESEEGQNIRLRNCLSPTSESEAGEKASKTDTLRNPKSDSTVHKKNKKEVRTVLRACVNLRLPERFMSLKAEQQKGAITALQTVEPEELHQAILDEWDIRCHENKINNPAGYLFGIIQKAQRGEFQPWAGEKPANGLSAKTSEGQPAQPSEQQSYIPVPREVAQEHVNRLRSILKS